MMVTFTNDGYTIQCSACVEHTDAQGTFDEIGAFIWDHQHIHQVEAEEAEEANDCQGHPCWDAPCEYNCPGGATHYCESAADHLANYTSQREPAEYDMYADWNTPTPSEGATA